MQSLTITNFFAEPLAVAKLNSYINKPNFYINAFIHILDIGLKRLDGFVAPWRFSNNSNCTILLEERIDLEFGSARSIRYLKKLIQQGMRSGAFAQGRGTQFCFH
jgi:hypothetical protein